MLQVQLAVRPRGDPVPVDIVVVQAHEHGLLAVDPELDRQAVGRGGLSGGAGACQQHHLGAPGADQVRHLGEALLVEGLIHPDELPDAAGGGELVQVRHILAFHQAAPALSLGEHTEKLGHGAELRQAVRIQVIREDKQEAPVGAEHIPHGQIPRRAISPRKSSI